MIFKGSSEAKELCGGCLVRKSGCEDDRLSQIEVAEKPESWCALMRGVILFFGELGLLLTSMEVPMGTIGVTGGSETIGVGGEVLLTVCTSGGTELEAVGMTSGTVVVNDDEDAGFGGLDAPWGMVTGFGCVLTSGQPEWNSDKRCSTLGVDSFLEGTKAMVGRLRIRSCCCSLGMGLALDGISMEVDRSDRGV